jgi:RNA polymerase sigma-70 factor (ECF subfamily)
MAARSIWKSSLSDRALLFCPLPLPSPHAGMKFARLFSSGGAEERRLREIMQAQHDFVWRSLKRLGVPSADTDDAVQEVFMILARRLHEVMLDRERSFLFGTAVRVASNHRRSRRRSPEAPADELEEIHATDLNPEELSALSNARRQLQEILDAMSAEQRSVFVLCELEELTVAAAAELLGLPLGTVSTRLRSARELFRKAAHRLEARRPAQRSPA